MSRYLFAGLKALASTIVLLGSYYFLAFLFDYDDRGLVVLGSALFTFLMLFLHFGRLQEEKSG
jgi:uncharacterized membrane protein